MPKFKSGYVQLKGGKAWNLSGVARLLLGSDHFLYMVEGLLEEDYRRFFFRDIQTIVVQRTSMRAVGNTVIAFLGVFMALLAAAIAGAASATPGWFVFIVTLAATPFAAGIVVNSLRGSTCRTYLRTATGATRLAPLDRVRKAQRALDELRGAVEEAQAELRASVLAEQGEEPEEPGDTFGMTVDAAAAKGVVLGESGPVAGAIEAARPLKQCSGREHFLLYLFILLSALHSLAMILLPATELFWLRIPLGIGTAFLLVWALICQSGSNLSAAMQITTWSYLAFMVLFSISLFPIGVAWAATQAVSGNAFDLPTIIESVPMFILLAFDAAISGLAGIFGLGGARRQLRRPAPAPPPLPSGSAAAPQGMTSPPPACERGGSAPPSSGGIAPL